MPHPFDRHSRRKDDWGTPGSRSAERAAAAAAEETDPAKRTPARKDPERCKGNQGGPHAPEVSLRHESPEDEFRSRCRWGTVWSREDRDMVVAWHCEHERRCTGCGLVSGRHVRDEECPVFPGTPEQRAVVQQQLFERKEQLRTSPRWSRRKPVITGPQGYRKKRAQAS
jgi:hypothetical protein